MNILVLRPLLAVITMLVLVSCSAPKVYQVDLIPAPDVIADGLVNPFPKNSPLETAPYDGILYATDRKPAKNTILMPKSDEEIVYYKNERSAMLRLGKGRIEIDRRAFLTVKDVSWEEIKKISMEKNRSTSYPLQIKDIEEFGILDRTYHLLAGEDEKSRKSALPGKKYADLINKKLAIS